jgi:RND superfamily putative drug exporter
MKGIATFCYRRRRFVVLGWIGLLAALAAASFLFAGQYRTEFRLPGSESQEAVDLLDERGVEERTGFFGQAVFRAEQGVSDTAVRQRMEAFFASIEERIGWFVP